MAKRIGYVVSLKFCYLSLDFKKTYRWTGRWLGAVVSLCFGALQQVIPGRIYLEINININSIEKAKDHNNGLEYEKK